MNSTLFIQIIVTSPYLYEVCVYTAILLSLMPQHIDLTLMSLYISHRISYSPLPHHTHVYARTAPWPAKRIIERWTCGLVLSWA